VTDVLVRGDTAPTRLVRTDDALQVIVRAAAATPVIIGSTGIAGPQGPAGEPYLTVTAGEAVGGHRVVALTDTGCRHADPTSEDDVWTSVGVTTGAAEANADATVVVSGLIDEPSWAWTAARPVFLAAAGTLTQTPPVPPDALYLRVVGVAVTATRLWVGHTPPIVLSE
jgi:hypothetical protein